MSQTVMVVLVLVFIGAMLVFALVMGIRGQRQNAQFEQECRARGWQVERGEGPGFKQQISGSTGGVGWRYEFFRYSSGSVNRSSRSEAQSARLQIDGVNLPGEIVLLMPRNAQASQIGQTIQAMNQFGGLGRMMIELIVIQGLHGDQADVENFLRLQPVMSGSEALRAQFTVLATREDTAAEVLKRSERALLEFTADPALKAAQRHATILLWSKGLTLPVERQITDVSLLENLVNLGITLANSIKGW